MLLQTNEKGSTLMEVLAVIAVVGVVAVGMFRGISTMNSKVKLTQAQTQVSTIVKNMRAQFSSFLPSSTTTTAMKEAGIFENKDVIEGTAVNVFGSDMTIEVKNDENPSFIFSYKDIPVKACSDLLMSDWGSDPSSGLKQIEVVTETPVTFMWKKDMAEGASHKELPPSLSDSVTACGKGSTATINWQYYL